jgi:hypothetical protein
MRNSKREKLMLKIAAATLFLGTFSPLAHAISPKEGVSLSDLSAIVPDLEVIQEGNNIKFAGTVPSRCVEGIDKDYKTEEGKHLLTIRMPNCENNFKREANEELVDLSDFLTGVKLKDADGKLYLRHLAAVSKISKNRIQDEILPTDVGNEIVLTSTQTKEEEQRLKEEEEAKAEAERLAQEEKLNRDATYDALADRLFQLCQDNDYVGLTKAINDASEFLGDVSSMLDQANDGLQGKLKKDLANADTADKAKEAYEAYLAAASEHGWDEDEITKSYIEKRFELLASLAEEVEEDSEEGSTYYKQVDRAAKEWSVELKALDRKEYKANQEKFGEIYSSIATKAANSGDISRAESYYDKAKRFVGADTDIKIDGAMAKIYTEKYKECVKNGPWKMEACDKKFLSKIKNRADSIKATLGRQSGDDAAEELAAFQAEYIGLFGAGASMNVSGFGQVSQMPGSIQKFKAQTYQEYVQQKQMEMMTQQMYGGMGGAMAAQPGSNFLGF